MDFCFSSGHTDAEERADMKHDSFSAGNNRYAFCFLKIELSFAFVLFRGADE